MITLGQCTISIVSGGRYKLDGGAMFGVVPKPLWERKTPADRRNRIDLETNCILVQTNSHTILIDTGNGTKFSKKQVDIFAIDKKTTLISSLASIGITPESIDYVLLSHLHFDHAGGATTYNLEGKTVPTFPRAQYIVQEGEWEDAINNYSVMKSTYNSENFIPLQEHGLLTLVKGDYEVCPEIRTVVTGAHTRFHQIVFIESEGQTAVYFGDLIPTRAHVKGAYSMAYDLAPYETKRQKMALLSRASEENWLILWDHDLHVPASRIQKIDEDTYQIEAVSFE